MERNQKEILEKAKYFINKTLIESKDEYKELVILISILNNLYYQQSISLVTDKQWDILFAKLKTIELKYPQWTLENSPTMQP